MSNKIITTPCGEEFNSKEYYESTQVNKGRSDKNCCYCGKKIPKGQKHTMHRFYPEFYAYPTHDMNEDHGDDLGLNEKSCTSKFEELFK